MSADQDRRHADATISFFNQLAVAFVAGAALQIFLTDLAQPAATTVLFMAGFALHGVAHILVAVTKEPSDDAR